MPDKLTNHKSEAGLARGVLSFILGSITLMFILEAVFLDRVIPYALQPVLMSPFLWMLLPVLGLFFGAIGIRSRGKYLAIIGMAVCVIALSIISFMLLY